MFSFSKIDNPEAAVFKLLKDLSINIDLTAISEELEKHPDYPSLLAVSDVLSSFNIENAAFNTGVEHLSKIPCPFIAYCNLNAGSFLVVNRIDGDDVIVSNEHWDRHRLSRKEFTDIFAGTVLTAEPTSDYKKTAKSSAAAALKTPLLIIGVLLILAASLLHNGYFTALNWSAALLSIFKTAGLITSVLLLIQSIDANSPLIQKLCHGGEKVNCSTVLSSKAAQVFEGLTWSEVGFFYFAGTWLLLLFGGNSANIWWAVAILNVISLPYTFYSIYYQAFVAKRWCMLCCTVQVLLWLEFISILCSYLLSGNPANTHAWAADAETILICLLTPVISWLLLKPLFSDRQQLKPLKKQLRSFKYNADLFNSMLMNQQKYTQPDEAWSIVLGNPAAGNVVTMVSNPYCGPCATMHKALDELLDSNENIQARIVFTADNSDVDLKTPVSRHLMALSELPDKEVVKQALHDWYEQAKKDYKTWASSYPVQINDDDLHKIDRQYAWFKDTGINGTPTMLLNGYSLPNVYRLQDLKYMLE